QHLRKRGALIAFGAELRKSKSAIPGNALEHVLGELHERHRMAVDNRVAGESVLRVVNMGTEASCRKSQRPFADCRGQGTHSFELENLSSIGREKFKTLHLGPAIGPNRARRKKDVSPLSGTKIGETAEMREPYLAGHTEAELAPPIGRILSTELPRFDVPGS